MVAGITVLVVESILMVFCALSFLNMWFAWACLVGMLLCVVISAIILPTSIRGIKTRTPSRGRAIANTAISGMALLIALAYAMYAAILLAVFSYF